MRIVFLFVVLTFFLLYSSCDSLESDEKSRQGYVLSPEEGEVLMRHSKRGTIKIKVSPKTGSQGLAMGTQNLAPGSKIPFHVHNTADEVLFIHRGSGIGYLGNEQKELPAGSTIFIPAGVWHGVENSNEDMELLWYVSPAGLDQFFRDLDSANISGAKQLTAEEVEEIAKKHGDSHIVPK